MLSNNDGSPILSTWVVCGLPGTGKSSLINCLTGAHLPTSNSAESVTTFEQAMEYARKPIRGSVALGLDNFCFCDSEGIGSSTTLSAENITNSFTPTFARLFSGAAGVIFCMKSCERLLIQDVLFAKSIFSACGKVPIIICMTKYDSKLVDACPDGNFDLTRCKPYVRSWALDNMPDILGRMGLRFLPEKFAVVKCGNQPDLDNLPDLIREVDALCDTPQIVKERLKAGIRPATFMDEETFKSVTKVAFRVVQQLSLSPWFQALVRRLLDVAGFSEYAEAAFEVLNAFFEEEQF